MTGALSFKRVARLVAIVMAILFLILLAVPQVYPPTFGIASDPATEFIARRASPLFLGSALILWVASTSPPSRLRSSIGAGVALIWIGFALTGLSDWTQGIATPEILVAAALEGLIAALLLLSLKN